MGAANFLILAGLAVHVAAQAALFAGVGLVRTWFYPLAWGSYLLFADGLNRRLSGRSPLIDRPSAFVGSALVSLPWWLAFEALNFRLHDWEYHGVPADLLARRLGVSLSFMSVLPGLWETRELAGALLFRRGPRSAPFSVPRWLPPAGLALGVAFLALPLVWPRWFYPLVWGAAFLLLEPWLFSERRSWLFEFSSGRAEPLLSWLAAGLACGLLWEAWNYGAGGRWVYAVPDAVGPKIFEMPLLGYIGFLPFALESASFLDAARLAWSRLRPGGRAAAAAALAAFSLAVLHGIDLWTVKSFQP